MAPGQGPSVVSAAVDLSRRDVANLLCPSPSAHSPPLNSQLPSEHHAPYPPSHIVDSQIHLDTNCPSINANPHSNPNHPDYHLPQPLAISRLATLSTTPRPHPDLATSPAPSGMLRPVSTSWSSTTTPGMRYASAYPVLPADRVQSLARSQPKNVCVYTWSTCNPTTSC